MITHSMHSDDDMRRHGFNKDAIQKGNHAGYIKGGGAGGKGRFRFVDGALRIGALVMALSLAGAGEPGRMFVLIEPKFMKAPVSAPMAGAVKTELVAAVSGETDAGYLSRAQFDALKVDWAAFAAGAEANAAAELEAVTVEYVRDRKKVIVYAAVRSPHRLVGSAVLASKFLDLFKETLGEKVLVVIPNRATAYVFPALASRYQEYAPLIFEAYRATAFPVSTEVFELSREGMKAVGVFEEP